MTLRIERSERDGFTVFVLSGRLDVEYVAELRKLLGPRRLYPGVILDLGDVKLVDRQSVRFLCYCEAHSLTIENCPDYIREWMEREIANRAVSDPEDLNEDEEQS